MLETDERLLTWPDEGNRRVPYAVFTDPAIFARENELIFRGPTWNFLGLEAEIPNPGDVKATNVAATPVLLVRTADGRMNPSEAIAQARKGKLLPLYLIVGEERFLRDQVVLEVRAAALGSGVPAFNEDKFQAGEGDIEKAISAARTVPMMAPKRFVLVRGLERWDSAREKAADKSDDDDSSSTSPLDRLATYAAEPIDSTCVVLWARRDKSLKVRWA